MEIELLNRVKNDMENIISQLLTSDQLKEDGIFVIGCSTSEVLGRQIGSAGSEQVAAIIYENLYRLVKEKSLHLAFQSCEHLNRSLVVERKLQKSHFLTEVSAIPTREAGGAMAAYAYQQMLDPVLVEEIRADAGIDIGQTMIGMHLKQVAVPLRLKQRTVHKAVITAASTRPKLIGGNRTTYQ